MGQIATAISILAVVIAVIGTILIIKGPDWVQEDSPETVTKTLAPGESFEHSVNLKRFDKVVGNLQSTGVADIDVKRVWFRIEEQVLNYQRFAGKFEFKNVFGTDYSRFDILIKNPEDSQQGTIKYSLTLQEFREYPSQYEAGNALLVIGVLSATFSAFKPEGMTKVRHVLFRVKLLDTTFRMVAICISFVGLIMIEIGAMGSLPPIDNPTFLADPKNIVFLSFTVLVFSIFPLAVFSYFISPRKIERRWKLKDATKDLQLQEICNSLSKDIGLKHPPQAYVTNSAGATCLTFGNNLRNYKLVISSRVKEILDEQELRSVLAHELSHAFHRDMIFITWGEVYLNFAKYWVLSIIALAILLAALNLSQLINAILFTSLFSVLGFLYSYFLINTISRDRELLADMSASEHTNSEFLKSALIKIKTESLVVALGSRLLLSSSLEGKFLQVFFSTHPTLKNRLSVIDGNHDVNLISASNVVHIGLLAGFAFLFFVSTIQQIAMRMTEGADWLLTILPVALIVGFLYGLYFAYHKVSDSFYEDFSMKKKAVLVWISSVLALILGNTLVFFVGQALFFRFDWQQALIVVMFGSILFAIAFPISLVFQFILKHVLK